MKGPQARSSSETSAARPRSALLLLTVFFTNLLALAGQVIWLRKLTCLFGSTAAVFSAVAAVFLLGLALGALAAGRVADRGARPWRRLALIEIGLGVYCLLSMPIFDLARRLFLAVFPGDLGPLSGALARLVVVLLVMIVPTMAIGAVFPLAVRLSGRELDRLGRDLARVYALDAFGAALGALLAGFVLVPELGLAASTWLLGAAAVGLGLVLLSARGRESRQERPAETQGRAEPVPGTGEGALAVIFTTFFLSGGAALLLETGWNRFFSLLNGTHLYSTSTVLAGFLAGIGAGSLLMGRWIGRVRNPFAAVAYLYAATALCGMLVFRSEGPFTRSYFAIFHQARGYNAFQLGVGLVILLIVFLATLAMGASFPLVARLATRTAGERGGSAGRIFFANTLGAALGALSGELVLLPVWGFAGLMVTTLALYVLAAIVFLALSPGDRRWLHMAACAVLLGAAVLLSPGMTPFQMPVQALYDHGLRAGSLAAYQRELRGLQLVDRKQGFYGEVDVVRSGPDLLLKQNGKTEAGTSARANRTQLLLGHLPLLFHPHPQRVLAIGLGGGSTLRAVIHHPEPRSVAVAEIDPLVVEAARRWFAPYNDRALEDPRVRVVTGDGRNFLDGTRERFDVIISGPPDVWVPGASGLFTQELYRSAAAHLSANGVLGQWVPLAGMQREDFRILLHTILTVFPNVTLWKVGTDVILLASKQPFQVELEPTRARLLSSALARDFTSIGLVLRDVLQIMNSPTLRPDQVSTLAAHEETVNVDDRPVLELSTARNLFELAKKR